MPDAWVTLALTLVIAVTVAAVALSRQFDPYNGWGLIASSALPWVALAGWPLWVTARKGNGGRIDLGLQMTRAQLRVAVTAGFVAYAVGLIGAWVTTRLRGDFTSTAGDVGSRQQGLVLVVFALLAGFVAPVVEEIAFRGLLFGALCKRGTSPLFATLVSALVFAAFHAEPARIGILIALGIVLGEVRRRTGSTSAAIVTHMMNNIPAAAFLVLHSVHG